MKSSIQAGVRDESAMNQLQTARILTIVVALAYPAGGILLQFYFGAHSDPWWLRIALMGAHLAVFGLSFRSQAVMGAMRQIMTVLFYVATLHVFYLVHLYELSLPALVNLLIVFTVVSSFFISRRQLILYLVFSSVCAAAVGLLLRLNPHAPVFVVIILVLSGLSYLLQNTRLQLIYALDESEKRFHALFDASFEGLVLHDNGIVQDTNPAMTRLFGIDAAGLIGKPLLQVIAVTARKSVTGYLAAQSEEPLETVGLKENGGTFYLELISRSQSFQGRPIQVTAFRDITERKRAEESIAQQAHRDLLTELPTRRLFLDRLGVALANAKRRKEGVAVMHLDIDNLKAINEKHGFDVGDLVLLGAATRMKMVLRETDTVARLGGDEFIFALQNSDALGARIAAEKLIDAFVEPFSIHGEELHVSVSIGISLFPEDSETIKVLMNKAHIALSAAKGQQRHGSIFTLYGEVAELREQNT